MVGTSHLQVELRLKKSRQSLRADFGAHVPAERIDAIFDDSVNQIRGGGRFDDYVAALAERLARERLRAAVRGVRPRAGAAPEVLFLALHDTGRGQMGAAFMRSLAGERVVVHSAGTSETRAAIDPGVESAMGELGIDLSDEYSKPLTAEVLHAVDVVVTMGRSTGSVEIPEGTRHVDWRIGDPGGAPMEEIRVIRDEIRNRVARLLDELV